MTGVNDPIPPIYLRNGKSPLKDKGLLDCVTRCRCAKGITYESRAVTS